jgi:hypothetical protein
MGRQFALRCLHGTPATTDGWMGVHQRRRKKLRRWRRTPSPSSNPFPTRRSLLLLVTESESRSSPPANGIPRVVRSVWVAPEEKGAGAATVVVHNGVTIEAGGAGAIHIRIRQSAVCRRRRLSSDG